jgi:hypothetical protein
VSKPDSRRYRNKWGEEEEEEEKPCWLLEEKEKNVVSRGRVET